MREIMNMVEDKKQERMRRLQDVKQLIQEFEKRHIYPVHAILHSIERSRVVVKIMDVDGSVHQIWPC